MNKTFYYQKFRECLVFASITMCELLFIVVVQIIIIKIQRVSHHCQLQSFTLEKIFLTQF